MSKIADLEKSTNKDKKIGVILNFNQILKNFSFKSQKLLHSHLPDI